MDLEGSVELGQERPSIAVSTRIPFFHARPGVVRSTAMVRLAMSTVSTVSIMSATGIAMLTGCETGSVGDGEVAEVHRHHDSHHDSHHDQGEGADSSKPASGTASEKAAVVSMEPIEVVVPGTSVTIAMQPITPGAGDPFYVATTEATWDLYDAFIFNLDTDAGESTEASDAVTRPSKPYVLADRGYGHAGYALLSASPAAVERFVEWLSVKTGRKIRVPTEAEMRHLLETSGIDDADARIASGWFEENAEYSTHAVGSKPIDANGLHDVWGNLSEYAIAADGTWVVMGGSFIDPVADVGLDYRIPFTTDWNADDPQIPKSPWWLASNDWVGVRLVCDP
jgi:formylglycine-generating enzyme required for sulfatase activity